MCVSSVQMENLFVFSSSCPVLVEPKNTEPTAKDPEHPGPSSLGRPSSAHAQAFSVLTVDSLKVYWMCLLCPSFPNFKSGALAQVTRDSCFHAHSCPPAAGMCRSSGPVSVSPSVITVSTQKQLNINCRTSPFPPFPPSVFSRVNVCLTFCLPSLFCVLHNTAASHHVT